MLSEKSYTRVTLALDIIRRIGQGPRKGYHELGVIKHQVSLFDTIDIRPSAQMAIECDNPRVPLDGTNVCWKAAEIMKKRYGIAENVTIRIGKNIPVQGGLAGGSANAASVIRLLDRLWGLGLDMAAMREIGAEVGMDVPYYFTGGTCFDNEQGIIEPVRTSLKLDIVLCIPPLGVSTREAYSRIDYSCIGRDACKTHAMLEALARNDLKKTAEMMHNDFEKFVFTAYPRLALLKQKLLEAGCLNAVMSGSGSTIIGLAADGVHAADICREISGARKCIAVHTAP